MFKYIVKEDTTLICVTDTFSKALEQVNTDDVLTIDKMANEVETYGKTEYGGIQITKQLFDI